MMDAALWFVCGAFCAAVVCYGMCARAHSRADRWRRDSVEQSQAYHRLAERVYLDGVRAAHGCQPVAEPCGFGAEGRDLSPEDTPTAHWCPRCDCPTMYMVDVGPSSAELRCKHCLYVLPLQVVEERERVDETAQRDEAVRDDWPEVKR